MGFSPGDVSSSGGVVQVIDEEGLADSSHGAGAVTTPGAFAAVCSVGPLAAGEYRVAVTTSQRGTVDANAANMRLFRGQQANGTGAVNLGAVLSIDQSAQLMRERVTVAAGDFLGVQVGSTAGGAASIYAAAISATRIA